MSDHDDRLPMQQMLEHACEAVEITRGHARVEMRTNRMLQLAVTCLVLVVGEVASRVSAARRARHPDIPWAKAIRSRNFIAHGYDRIDYDVIWATVADDFPPLGPGWSGPYRANPRDAQHDGWLIIKRPRVPRLW
jgi:uncharacterized protein with HEPN domain